MALLNLSTTNEYYFFSHWKTCCILNETKRKILTHTRKTTVQKKDALTDCIIVLNQLNKYALNVNPGCLTITNVVYWKRHYE